MRPIAVACLIAVLAGSVAAGEMPLEERISVGQASVVEVRAALSSADEAGRRTLYLRMAEWPAKYGGLLLERLDDRLHCRGIRRLLAAGEFDPETATPLIEKHHESPHAFVRIRAAEALVALDRERAIRWLEEELRIRRTWCRVSTRMCDGSKGGLEGRIERLKNHPGLPVDPYDTVGDTVVVPAEHWRLEVVALPFRGRPTFEVLLRNAATEPFLRLPDLDFGRKDHWKASLGRAAGLGGGCRCCGHPNMVDRIEQGQVAFDLELSYPIDDLAVLDRVTLDFRFTIPGRRSATTSVTVPASLLRPLADLDAYRAGMTHEDPRVRDRFRSMFSFHWSEKLEVAPEFRRGVIDILVPALEAVPPREDPEPVFFWRTRAGTRGVTGLVDSLVKVREGLLPADFDRLLRLRNSCAVRDLRRLSSDPRLLDAVRRALASVDPLLVRNIEFLRPDHGRPPSPEFLDAVARWLRSGDTVVLRAGLHVLYRSELEPEGWEAAVSRALDSEDARIVRAAVFTASRRSAGIDRRLFDVFRTTDHAAVRLAVLEALESKLSPRLAEADATVLREFLAPLLADLPEPRDERRLVRSLVSLDARLAAVPALVVANERSGDDLLEAVSATKGLVVLSSRDRRTQAISRLPPSMKWPIAAICSPSRVEPSFRTISKADVISGR